MQNGTENFILTNKGDIDTFLGIEITQLDEKRFKTSQPFLINRIISLLIIDQNEFGLKTNNKSTPVSKPLLHKDLSDKPCKEAWNYQMAVGILTYLQVNTRP